MTSPGDGRTEQVHVRLSSDEAALLDRARRRFGGVNPAAALRALLTLAADSGLLDVPQRQIDAVKLETCSTTSMAAGRPEAPDPLLRDDALLPRAVAPAWTRDPFAADGLSGAWLSGLLSAGVRASRPIRSATSRLVAAVEAHCPPSLPSDHAARFDWLRARAADWARSSPRTINPFAFGDWLDSGSPSTTSPANRSHRASAAVTSPEDHLAWMR